MLENLFDFHSANKYHYFEPLEIVEFAKLAKGRRAMVNLEALYFIILKNTEEKDS